MIRDISFDRLDVSSDVLEIVLNVLEQYATYGPKLVDHDNYPKNKVLSDISNAEIKAAMNTIDSWPRSVLFINTPNQVLLAINQSVAVAT